MGRPRIPALTFARMARLTGLSRDKAEEQLSYNVETGELTQDDLNKSLDKAYAEDAEYLSRMFQIGGEVIAHQVKYGDGRDIDSRGLDAADRAIEALFTVMGTDKP